MIVLFTCCDNCYQHLFVMTAREFRSACNHTYGRYAKGIDFSTSTIYILETLGL